MNVEPRAARDKRSISGSRERSIGSPKAGWARSLPRLWLCLLECLALAGTSLADEPDAPSGPLIRVETEHAALVLATGANGRLYQVQFGTRPAGDLPLPKTLPWAQECYPQSDDGFIEEPP